MCVRMLDMVSYTQITFHFFVLALVIPGIVIISLEALHLPRSSFLKFEGAVSNLYPKMWTSSHKKETSMRPIQNADANRNWTKRPTRTPPPSPMCQHSIASAEMLAAFGRWR